MTKVEIMICNKNKDWFLTKDDLDKAVEFYKKVYEKVERKFRNQKGIEV